MRSSICGAAGLMAVGLLSLAPIGANAQKAESGLLGNKLWQSFEQVLRLQGQPSRIEVGAVTGVAPTGQGGGAAAMPGMPSMGGGSPYGGPPSGAGGSPYGGSGGMSGMMSRMGGGGGKMGGGPGLPGMPGMPGMGGGQGEGMPGGMPGMPAMGGGQMNSGPAGGTSGASEGGEITWVYEKGGRTNIFLFNKDGRLIQIASYGYSGPAVTSRGVRLGDPIGKIYAKYGWTANITKDAARNTMALDYSKDHHVAYQLADRGKGYRVIGITVGITELNQLQDLAPGVDFGNARATGMMGTPMGGPMGMRGGPMGMSGGGPMGGAAGRAMLRPRGGGGGRSGAD